MIDFLSHLPFFDIFVYRLLKADFGICPYGRTMVSLSNPHAAQRMRREAADAIGSVIDRAM